MGRVTYSWGRWLPLRQVQQLVGDGGRRDEVLAIEDLGVGLGASDLVIFCPQTLQLRVVSIPQVIPLSRTPPVRATLPVQLPVPLSIPDTTCSQQA